MQANYSLVAATVMAPNSHNWRMCDSRGAGYRGKGSATNRPKRRSGPAGLGQPSGAATISEPVIGDTTGAIAEVGDLVTVRYNAEPGRPIRIRLSRTENRPDEGVVHIGQPLASAVLGASVDDVIKVEIGGRMKKAVIERIEKASSQEVRQTMMANA